MALCKFCNKWMTKGTGKREKVFCNSTCKSNFWYAKNKKGKVVEVPTIKLDTNKIYNEPIIMRPFETYQQLILECDNIDDYRPLKAEIQAATHLTEKQKNLLLRKP